MISPCINIGIGKDGIDCLERLASIFDARESEFPKQMSFLTVDLENEIQFKAFNKKEKAFKKYDLSDKVDEKLTENHVFLATAYNDLISILNVLGDNLQYTYININLIYSALEKDLSIIKIFGEIIEQYTDEGTFGTVVIKNYVMMSDGTGVLSTEQENVATKNLKLIQDFRGTNRIVDSIFILDDKNLNAVFLGYKNEYISFALYEFFIAIMTNQYKLISNLPGKNNILSFGIGSVFFDKLYFNVFFDYKIFSQFLKNEGISKTDKNSFNLEILNIINPRFVDFFKDCNADLSEIFNLIELSSAKVLNTNIGSYYITLKLMLGIEQCSIVNIDELAIKYTIKDLIFNVIYNYVLEEKKEIITVNTAKQNYVKLYYDRKELRELKSLEGDYKLEIELLEERIESIKESLILYEKQLELSFLRYKKPLERKHLKLSQSKDLNSRLKAKENELRIAKELYQKKGFFRRLFFTRSYKREITGINLDIADIKLEIIRYTKSVAEVQKALDSLFCLYDLCEKYNNRIGSIVDSLQDHNTLLSEEWNKSTYIDYSFVQNIIDENLFKDYFKLHKVELTQSIRLPLKKLIDYSVLESTIKSEYITLALNSRIGIIDFCISKYMLGEYDGMLLFKDFNFKVDINKLKERGRPFINVVPTYKPQTHELFSIYSSNSRDKVLEYIKDYYSSAIPLTIDSPNKDRFLSINIESVVSVNEVAKSSKTEEE